MKMLKLVLVSAVLLLSPRVTAQTATDKNLFNHLAVGLSTGTDGLIGLDVAAPIGNYVSVRAGYQFMPKFTLDVDIDYQYNGSRTSTAQGKLNVGNFKLLFDAYPFQKSSFHVTAGAYIGTSKLAEAYNKGPLDGVSPADYGVAKIQISDNPNNFFGTDLQGNVKGRVKVNSFKPYLGVGFGHVVPKSRLSFNFDLGMQFWGKPKVEIYNYQDFYLPSEQEWKEIKKSVFNDHDDDAYKALNILSKLTVYPVLNFRLGFKAF